MVGDVLCDPRRGRFPGTVHAALAARDRQPYYCTLLLLEAVRPHAPQFSPQWQYLDMAVFRGEYLFPEAFMHENVEWIYRSE